MMVFLRRSRQLDLQRLESMPQENLSMVHAILRHGVSEVMEKLGKLELQYYGKKKDPVEEIKKWGSIVKGVIATAHTPIFSKARQIDEIAKRASDPAKKFKVDMFQLNKAKEAVRKVQDFVPYKMNDILKDLTTILEYLEKYCLTFYDTDKGVSFDTAKEYEERRDTWRETIADSIHTVKSLGEKFRNDGVTTQDFSAYGRELGQKAGCFQYMFLAMFPESCECVRTACKAVKSWIETDASYALYISYDLTDLEAKRDHFLKSMRDLQQRYASLCFGLKNLEVRCEKLEEELHGLKNKADELTTEEELLREESNEIQLEIDRKEWRRGELLKNHHLMHPEVFQEKFNEVTEILRDMKSKLPFVKRQLTAVIYKLSWIDMKKDEVVQEKRKRDLVKEEMESIEQDRLEREIEYENILKILELAKHIYKCKSTPDSVSKIYHGQEVEINNARLPGNKGGKDPFEVVCDIVIKRIGQDWPRLYRELPFIPGRGHSTIDKDITELAMLEQRIGPREVAKKCLNRWRRFHTRAKMSDLLEALKKIRRRDLVSTIDRILDPQKYEEPDIFSGMDDNSAPIVEDYLIPSLREIEKYDRLKAAGRIA